MSLVKNTKNLSLQTVNIIRNDLMNLERMRTFPLSKIYRYVASDNPLPPLPPPRKLEEFVTPDGRKMLIYKAFLQFWNHWFENDQFVF